MKMMFERIFLCLCFQTQDKMFVLIGSLSPARAGEPAIAPFGLTSQTGTTGKSYQDQRGRTPLGLSRIAPLTNVPEE